MRVRIRVMVIGNNGIGSPPYWLTAEGRLAQTPSLAGWFIKGMAEAYRDRINNGPHGDIYRLTVVDEPLPKTYPANLSF